MYNNAIDKQVVWPVSGIIYVLAQEDPDFYDSWIGLEQDTFDAYLNAAKRIGCSYREIPWLFVKARSWKPHAAWLTELIPTELATSAITVDPSNAAGIPELALAIDRMLAGTSQSS